MLLLDKICYHAGLKSQREFRSEYSSPKFRRKVEGAHRVRILGDHSDLHCGCQAVIQGIESAVTKKGWQVVGPFEVYDILIVNGEGSMHRNRSAFRRKMKVLKKAASKGIPCYLLNSVWEKNPHTFDDVLPKITGITVRERLSQIELKEKHHTEALVIVDASYLAEVDPKASFINYNNKPIVTDFYYSKTGKWGEAPAGFTDLKKIDMEKMSWSSFVLSLKTASYLITGRHHAVYGACKARIPFVASESNTHKISGLIKSANVQIPIAKTPEDVKVIVEQLPSLKEEYAKLFTWMDQFKLEDIIPGSRNS